MSEEPQPPDTETPPPESVLYSGTCVRGPFSGQTRDVRYPEGFIAIDKLTDTCTVYRHSPDGTFVAGAPEPVDPGKLGATVVENLFDVLSV